MGLDARQFGKKQVLLTPLQIFVFDDESGLMRLNLPAAEMQELPLAGSVLPVCRQYASLALGSPGARIFSTDLVRSDPHLRSARVVNQYSLDVAGEYSGTLVDLIFDDETWEIRYLAVEQRIEHRKIQFHIIPQSVERFTWATQRVLLRNLNPVELAATQWIEAPAVGVAA